MKSLFKKFLEFAIGNGIVMIIGFLTAPVITRIMNKTEYGKATMFLTVTSLLISITMVGMDQVYVRYFNDEEEKNKPVLLRKTILIPIVMNLIVSLGLIVLYKPISNLVIGETSLEIIFIIILENILNVFSNFAILHLRMKQRGKAYSFVSVINRLAYLVFALLLYKVFNGSFMVMIISTVIANALRVIIAILLEYKDWSVIIKRKGNLKVSNKELIRFGTPFIFSVAITWIFQSSDKLAIQYFLGFDEVAVYGSAMSIIGVLSNLQGAFTTFWTPVAYEKFNKDANCKEFFIKINKIVSLAMILLSIGLIAFKDIIILILGNEYRDAVYTLPFLVFMPIMYTISETTVLGINFMHKTKYHIYISLAAAIANIVGNIILVPILGVKGAAISTGVAYVVFFVMRTYFANKFYKIGFNFTPLIISIISVYSLAIFSSFVSFGITSICVSLLSAIVVLVCYIKEIKSIIYNGLIMIREKK